MSFRARWLARLSLSLLVIAGVLAIDAYQSAHVGAALWRTVVDAVAAAAALSLGVEGFRVRHRHRS